MEYVIYGWKTGQFYHSSFKRIWGIKTMKFKIYFFMEVISMDVKFSMELTLHKLEL
jgi:hypothetical protein